VVTAVRVAVQGAAVDPASGWTVMARLYPIRIYYHRIYSDHLRCLKSVLGRRNIRNGFVFGFVPLMLLCFEWVARMGCKFFGPFSRFFLRGRLLSAVRLASLGDIPMAGSTAPETPSSIRERCRTADDTRSAGAARREGKRLVLPSRTKAQMHDKNEVS
jgi:hypothetical protein